jgi:uncharacterized Zn-finger protein
MNTDKQYTCKICQRSFSQKSSLQRHIRINCGRGVKRRTCAGCNIVFSRKSSLNRHMQSSACKPRVTADVESIIKDHHPVEVIENGGLSEDITEQCLPVETIEKAFQTDNPRLFLPAYIQYYERLTRMKPRKRQRHLRTRRMLESDFNEWNRLRSSL